MIKTVYFDLGNVLIFFSHPKMVAQVAECTGLEKNRLKELLIEQKWLHAYESGKISSLKLYEILQAHSPKSFSLDELLNAASDIFTPNYEIWPLVQQLKTQGIRLILLSNTCECHYTKIESTYPILELFDHKVLSFEVGFCKPDPRIFQKALTFAKCKPEECFYIDDIPDFIASAQQEGLQGTVYTGVADLKEKLEKKSQSCTEI